ncbi:hypothetical protein D9M71_489410 [compost metagenome]
MASATGVEPTKEIASMAGWHNSSLTASLSPLITVQTPSGKPASFHSSDKNNAEQGTRSDGLRITQFPTATAILVIASGTMTGKLNGEIAATMPNGSFRE